MEKNLDVTKPRYREQILPALVSSLYRGSTVLSGGRYFWVAKTCIVHGLYKVMIIVWQQL